MAFSRAADLSAKPGVKLSANSSANGFCATGFCAATFRAIGLAILATAFAGLVGVSAAQALEAVNVRTDAGAIDLTDAVEFQHTDGDRIQVSTPPGADGIIRRIEVRAREAGGNWAVFALANNGDEQIDRLIVVPHYRMVGSGVIWPDLGQSRIVYITPSSGDPPERQVSADADVYRITLDPGTVITFVAELRTDNLPQLYLWEPDAYKDKLNSLTLYQGIVIGIAGLLALFLTILFVVKGSVMFPAAAALGWAVLIYIGIDFGFWPKVFDMSSGAERIWRASGEAILAATLLVFLFAYLNLNRWHVRYAHITVGWLAFLGALVAVALFSPAVASGIARISLFLIAVLGFALVIYLATHDYDRAVMLIPTWLLLVVWVIGAALTVLGFLTNDIVGPALLGGLVLIVMLIGFTVMQHAFAGGMTSGIVSDVERRALALTGAGDMIWDWDVSADKVFTSPETEAALGLKHGSLDGPAAKWLDVLHQLDRDRFRATLDSVLEQRRGRVAQDFRLRTADGHYLWFALRARPVVGSDGEVVRLVGTLSDVTEFKTAEERLLHDAVHDNLTGLPNRELFLDRLEAVLGLAKTDAVIRPTVMVVDLDRFKQVNDSVGMAVGDFDPAHSGAPPRAADQAAGHAGAPLGRPVRPHFAVGTRRGAHHRAGRNHPAHAARSDHLQRPRNIPHRLDRTDARQQRIAARRGGAQGRRACHVSRQARRRRSHRRVQGRDARAQGRPAVDRIRSSPRAGTRRDHHPLSTDRAARRSRHRRLRGAGALESPETRPGVAGRVHQCRRGNRADRRARPVRSRPYRAPALDLAAHAAPSRNRVCQRQRLVAPVAASRSDPGPAHRAGACAADARFAQARTYRVRW